MRTIKIDDLPDFDPTEHLRNNEEIAAYLSAVIEEDDPDELLHALGVAARARGMTEIARETGLAREALYRALRKGAATRLDTVSRVCKALGLRLTVTSVDSERKPGIVERHAGKSR